ncbi:MAG: AIR synthase-related protein [bacterium]|nr:AIR synthase-related protein [bacterium]
MSTDPPPLPAGKLPPGMLRTQLGRIPAAGPGVRIGPRYGEDAAAVRVGDRYLVCACDPITLASRRIGWYAVHVNANDVAVLGARPAWFWATVLLPAGRADGRLVDETFAEMRAACASLGVELCGGHTELTAGLPRPVICGFMAGEVDIGGLVDKASVRPGDAVILTRGIAIEGTAAIAAEAPRALAGLDPSILDRARGLLDDPGISVVREALLAARTAPVHGMHDPTEGGLLAGLRELAEAAGAGLLVEEARIPVLPETAAICGRLGIDPMGLLASGALLIAAGEAAAARIIPALEAAGVPARVIGRVEEPGAGIMLARGGTVIPLPECERDEIARVL